MTAKLIDPLLMVGVRAVQRDVALAQKMHDQFLTELYRRYDLDPAKRYAIGDDGAVTELLEDDPAKKAATNGGL